jgi:predicted ribosomally synthesized peptide with SipW-like signal peptide
MFNKKTFLSLLTIGTLVCVASAGTWAYFDSSQSVVDNRISTGTLHTQLRNTDGTPAVVSMNADNAKPGDDNVPLTHIPVVVTNIGSLNGVLSMKVVPISGEDLSKYLTITATITNLWTHSSQTITLWENGAATNQGLDFYNLDSLYGRTVDLKYSFPETHSPQSDASGDSFNFNVEFSLKQR